MAQVYNKSNDYRTALGFYQEALKGYEENRNREKADVYVQIGDTYMKLDEYHQATGFYSQALQIYQNLNEPNTQISRRETVDIYSKLGNAYFGNRDLEMAIKSYIDALDARKTLNMPEDMTTIKLVYNIASIYLSLGEAKKALEYFHGVIDLFDIVLGDGDHVEKANCYLRIGDSYIMVPFFLN